ncbi:hypothetical protein C8R44DRAFT_728158 [Mycena epipterygia]|nr:hypothetical protein C8R44DRAFT_728158 [Mycena epipterygia]
MYMRKDGDIGRTCKNRTSVRGAARAKPECSWVVGFVLELDARASDGVWMGCRSALVDPRNAQWDRSDARMPAELDTNRPLELGSDTNRVVSPSRVTVTSPKSDANRVVFPRPRRKTAARWIHMPKGDPLKCKSPHFCVSFHRPNKEISD